MKACTSFLLKKYTLKTISVHVTHLSSWKQICLQYLTQQRTQLLFQGPDGRFCLRKWSRFILRMEVRKILRIFMLRKLCVCVCVW